MNALGGGTARFPIAEVPRCDNVWPRQRLPAELQPLCAPPTCCAGIRYRSAIDLVY